MREVSKITSSPVGKDRLGPCLTALFQKQGIELKDIRLDKPAGVRLMGMLPPLETRANNETIEQIFSGLELSAFLAQDQTLYILGDKENISLMGTGVSAPAASRSQIELPEMIDMGNYRIMKAEVTVGLFKQVMQDYKIEGHNADKLKDFLSDPANEEKTVTYVSLIDAEELAKRLSELTGRKFRVQTEAEWLQAKDQLTGNNATWTKTEGRDSGGSSRDSSGSIYVLRRLGRAFSGREFPDVRDRVFAIRLVEDLPTEAEAAKPYPIRSSFGNRIDIEREEARAKITYNHFLSFLFRYPKKIADEIIPQIEIPGATLEKPAPQPAPSSFRPNSGPDFWAQYFGPSLWERSYSGNSDAILGVQAPTKEVAAPQPPLSAEEFRARNIGPTLWGRSYSEEYEARLAGQAPTVVKTEENGQLSQEERERRIARLEDMGVKLYHAYTTQEEREFDPDPGMRMYDTSSLTKTIDIPHRDDYPDWLKNALIANYEKIKFVFEQYGRERLAGMFESIGNPEVQILLKTESAERTRLKVSSFIELMDYMGKSRYYLNFGAWVWRNREEIKNEGLGKLLFVVTNVSPEEIDRMLNIT